MDHRQQVAGDRHEGVYDGQDALRFCPTALNRTIFHTASEIPVWNSYRPASPLQDAALPIDALRKAAFTGELSE